MKKDFRFLKVGNESIDKQEWSMFNGLRKDAEKEIGNEFATAPKTISIGDNVETLTGKKGNVVEKNGHILKIKLSDGSFEYEHEYKAKKVGNATGDEYNAEIQRLTKKAEQLRRMGQGRSDMEIEKQIEKLGKELHELENKKTGNRTIRTEKKGDWVVVYINGWKAGAGKAEYKGSVLGWQTDGNTYGMTPSGMKSSSAFRKTYRTEPTDKQIEKDLIEDFWIHHNDKETMEKIGNSKTGNAQYGSKEDIISHLDTDLYEIHQRLKQKDESPWRYLSELQKKGYDMGTLSRHNKDIGKIIEKLKTGNKKLKFTDKKDSLTEYVYDEETQTGYIYYDGKLADTKRRVGPGWVELIKQKAFPSGVHNSKIGNETPEEMEVKYKGYNITYFPYQKKYMVRHPNEVSGLMQKHFTSVDEAKKAIDKKVGNAQWYRSYYKEKIDPAKWSEFEREFDKLNQRHIEEKTLAEQDGKRPDFEKQQREADMVVKKYALNNLKRARNAMNKKCGNAQITLWKGNDTVLISEDGTVQYLESNSFEVDRAKYDSQQKAIEEMTKEGYRKK